MTEEVIQADREAAADLWSAVFPHRQGEADCMRRGIGDVGPVVEAFARHRLAHLPTDLSEHVADGVHEELWKADAALRTQRNEVVEAKREVDKWRRVATDRAYMIDALVPMLGPVAREVWDGWREKGVQRIHFSWGLEGEKLRGEEMASMIRDFQNASCERIDNIDGDFPTSPAIRNLKSQDEPR